MRLTFLGILAAVAGLLSPALAIAQINTGTGVLGNNAATGGVWIDTDGTVRLRQVDQSRELAEMRDRVMKAQSAAKNQRLCYISLPKLLDEVRTLSAAGKPIPDELRNLGGMVQLRYVFVYPQERELILAGPSEPWDDSNKLQPVGKFSGRPVLQLDDLVLAIRLAGVDRGQAFGCSIDPAPDSLTKAMDIHRKMSNRPLGEVIPELVKAMGPQKVSVFGAGADTRTAYICVAADYRLKRLCMGLDAPPVGGVGNPIDSSRPAAERFWFEAMYDPMLVSPEGDAFEIRGQRLQLKAGAQSFDPKGATAGGIAYAKRFTEKMPAMAAAIPLFADLQNIADLSLLASLIRQDKLDGKVGMDLSWTRDPAGYKLMSVPVPHTAETLGGLTNGSIVVGGVSFELSQWSGEKSRAADEKATLAAPRQQATPAAGTHEAIRYAGPTSQPKK